MILDYPITWTLILTALLAAACRDCARMETLDRQKNTTPATMPGAGVAKPNPTKETTQ